MLSHACGFGSRRTVRAEHRRPSPPRGRIAMPRRAIPACDSRIPDAQPPRPNGERSRAAYVTHASATPFVVHARIRPLRIRRRSVPSIPAPRLSHRPVLRRGATLRWCVGGAPVRNDTGGRSRLCLHVRRQALVTATCWLSAARRPTCRMKRPCRLDRVVRPACSRCRSRHPHRCPASAWPATRARGPGWSASCRRAGRSRRST